MSKTDLTWAFVRGIGGPGGMNEGRGRFKMAWKKKNPESRARGEGPRQILFP